jgi:hypothetical protein
LPFWHKWVDRGRITGGAKHDFQDAFKNDRSSGDGPYARRRSTSRVMVASRPKVSFWLDNRTSPGNYGWDFVCI